MSLNSLQVWKDRLHCWGERLLNYLVAGFFKRSCLSESCPNNVSPVSRLELVVKWGFLDLAWSFVFGSLDFWLFLRCSLQSVLSPEVDEGVRRGHVWTSLGCGKHSALVVRCHSLAGFVHACAHIFRFILATPDACNLAWSSFLLSFGVKS